jgi:hypothetical protein
MRQIENSVKFPFVAPVAAKYLRDPGEGTSTHTTGSHRLKQAKLTWSISERWVSFKNVSMMSSSF